MLGNVLWFEMLCDRTTTSGQCFIAQVHGSFTTKTCFCCSGFELKVKTFKAPVLHGLKNSSRLISFACIYNAKDILAIYPDSIVQCKCLVWALLISSGSTPVLGLHGIFASFTIYDM